MTDSNPPDAIPPDPLPGLRFAVRTEVMFWEGVVQFLQQNLAADPEATVEQALAAALMAWEAVRGELDDMVRERAGYAELAEQIKAGEQRMTQHATGAQDPHWVDTDETIVVVMNPMDAVVYQRFLRSRDLCLERIPGATIDAGPIYGIAARG
jgi:hypothetical protein